MLVRYRMSPRVISAEPQLPLAEARALLQRHRIRQAPVLSKRRLVGIVTDRDLRSAPATAQVVRDVMTPKPFVIAPDAAVDEAAYFLRTHKINALPVVEGARVLGIFTTTDALDAFVELCGVAEPTYRLALTAPGGQRVDTEIRRIIEHERGELKWLHHDPHRQSERVDLRLKAGRLDDIVTALEGAGFEVNAVVAPPRQRSS